MRTTTPNRRWSSPLAAAVAAATLLTALPSVAHASVTSASGNPADELALTDTVEDIGPGISLRHLKAVDEGGWYDARFLTVDLSEDAVSTDLLTAGPVASAGPLSTAANRAGAVAGVNGEFFDIGNSNAALGGEVQDGVLRKSADIGGREHVGVSSDGIAQLVDLAVDASADLAGAAHDVLSVNAANGGGVPANGMVAYTPVWGEYSRNRGFTGVPADRVAEVIVQDDVVVSVAQTGPAGSGTLPEGAFSLVGRDGAADALRALRPGDPVSLRYGLADDATRDLEFALGHGGTIVRDGKVVEGLQTSVAPRTALGFKDGGRTLVLATWDGPGGTGKGGVGIDKTARDLVRLGVETAVNLDGGGSTTLVARALGDQDATLRNVPSDGHERNDPNGVGVFVAPGDGRLHDLLVSPAPGAAGADGDLRVFPGLHRTLVAKGTDDHETPVEVDADDVRWDARGASVTDGRLQAPVTARGEIIVTARSGRERDSADVRVLGALDDLELSTERLSIAEATSSAVTVGVTGRDAQGFTAPIEAGDLELDYDHDVVQVEPAAGGLRITPLKDAATILTISVAGQEVQLSITIGVQNVTVYDFDDDVLARWRNNSTRATTFSADPDGLRVDFEGMRNVGVSAASASVRVPVPGQPLRLRVRLRSSISVPSGLTYIAYVDATGKSGGVYGTGLTPSDDWQQATFTLPATTAYPISITGWQGINTNAAQQKPGTFVLDRIEADVPTSIELPPRPDLEADPLISADGEGLDGQDAWSFATLSDVQFTADNTDLTQVATTALHTIRATRPDLVVLNGDITDRGLPQDVALARQVLEDAGCDLVAVGEEPAPSSTPDPRTGTVPCYYVPGNHESYGLNNTQATLDPFVAEFGQPYRTFDHKGTRFVLLASSYGTLRGTAWDQLPMLQKALADAERDRSVDNVVVFAHHPVADPGDTAASQLGDGNEVALVQSMLTGFRERTDKGAVMVGSHAQIVDVHREEGVPYVVLPSSGKSPYGTPDRGGFTGWVSWSVDPRGEADEQWVEADVRAFAQSVALTAPETLEVGTTAQLSGSIVQPNGVAEGTRVVPLRYPMSVHWSGSRSLAIGSGERAVEAARRAGKVAVLDPETRILTALRRGEVTVSVTNDAMRPYDGDASLAPVTTSETIEVVPAANAGPRITVEAPVFTAQPVGTRGQVQKVTITSTGTAPVRIRAVDVEDDERHSPFSVDHDRCDDRTLAPGRTCEVWVRFDPVRAGVTSTADLELTTNGVERTVTVPLTGISTTLTWARTDDGPARP
ncbi:phosphodiester glycosidase family protein [Promicromonospora sp. MEB111]|uniref:phosphodiester glycosidase family protein n=1 Tax=Promicromonospora sp. MEB111 TaxID=3040301 RepID=UPI00254FE220|nr:phosphodiester glycosidase family protein [Promicromonospora sp. MEB111]